MKISFFRKTVKGEMVLMQCWGTFIQDERRFTIWSQTTDIDLEDLPLLKGSSEKRVLLSWPNSVLIIDLYWHTDVCSKTEIVFWKEQRSSKKTLCKLLREMPTNVPSLANS